MKRNYISDVIRTFLNGNYPNGTERQVQQWLVDEQYSSEKDEALQSYWDSMHIAPDESTYRSLRIVNGKIGLGNEKRQKLSRRWFLRIAAVLIPVCLIVGLSLYVMKENTYVNLTVSNGEMKETVLPDGSKIWVNAGSSVHYPKEFKGSSRTVKLRGEAYFSVSKDEDRPFIVETDGLSVKVLGTEFNVSAYPDQEKIITTLTNGRIEVATKSRQVYRLEPDQQLVYNTETSEIELTSTDAAQASAWKTGDLIFDYSLLKDILSAIERKFNVSVTLDKSLRLSDEHYSVKFVNGESIDQIMEVLRNMCGFTYSIEGDEIRIKQ